MSHAYAERPVNTFPHPNTKPFHKGMPFGEENKTMILQKSPHYLHYIDYVYTYILYTLYTCKLTFGHELHSKTALTVHYTV